MPRTRRPPAQWPSWFYSPTGEGKICDSEEEVPPGWVRNLGQQLEPAPEPVILDRDDLVAQLEALGVEINPIWGNAHLKRMLDDRSPAR